MRHRVDISLEYKAVLKEVSEKLGGVSERDALHMCIQSVHDNIVSGDQEDLKSLNPTQEKLDRILSMLEEVLPEV